MFDFFKGFNYKTLLPMFLMFGRAMAAKLRTQDADTIGGDDEAAEAIEYAISRVENFLANKPKV